MENFKAGEALDLNKSRAEFEQHFKNFSLDMHKDDEGDEVYSDDLTQGAWLGWCAALARAGIAADTGQAEPVADSEPRFYMDHGVWHDRVTGQHLWTQDQYDAQWRTMYKEGQAHAAIGYNMLTGKLVELATVPASPVAVEQRFTNVWNDALEEAAKVCDAVNNHDNPMTAGDCADAIRELKGQSSEQTTLELHEDDIAVSHFADVMRAKMAASRAKGREGWGDTKRCPTERLQSMLLDHLAKGDPVDVANFCMMLWARGQPTKGLMIPKCGGDGIANKSCANPQHQIVKSGATYCDWTCTNCGGSGRNTWD